MDRTILQSDVAISGYILTTLETAEALHDQVTREIERLAREGIWPQLPREVWESRRRQEQQYMYLIFNDRAVAGGAKRKVYVGAHPDAVAQARAKVERTKRLNILHARAQKLYDAIERLREQFKYCAYIAEDAERVIDAYR